MRHEKTIRKSKFILHVLLFVFVGTEAFAFSQTPKNIFDKRNRVLMPPPKSLRADSEQLEYRLALETERIEAGVENPRVNSVDIQEEFDAPREKKKSRNGATQYRYEENESNGTDKVKPYAFSGKRVFGLGLVGAGSYGVFGAEVDFSVDKDWTVGLGLGTGMNFSSWTAHARYFLQQGRLNTFFQFGYANWFLGKVSSRSEKMLPQFLTERFFTTKDGNFSSSQHSHLIYPAIGVLFQYESGLASTLVLQYLVSARNFAGALFGSAGFFYYF